MHKTIDPTGYGFTFGKGDWVAASYDPFFNPLVGKGIKLLELGIQEGVSLRFWRDYFENANIVGLDCSPVNIEDPTGMIHVYKGYQQDIHLLDRIAKEQAPDGFDVIIDDCSHIGMYTRISFWHLFDNHLKPGGIYAIEDYGTGYMNEYPDGKCYNRRPHSPYSWLSSIKGNFVESILSRLLSLSPKLSKLFLISTMSRSIPSHNYGMVGFVKELIDACCLGQIVSPNRDSRWCLDYNISQLYFIKWFVIVLKAKERQSTTL